MHRNLLPPASSCPAPPSPVRALARIAVAALTAFAATACGGPATGQNGTTPAPTSVAAGSTTRVVSFAVSNENLNVDKVGLRDGFMKPDGNRDLAFTASIDGPFEALFIVSTSAKGEPGYGLRADTLTGKEEIPTELGGVIDTGKMTVGIGVVEGGKFINGESGSVHGGPGLHTVTLYVPNTATLQPGSFVRIYVRVPGGELVRGPVTPY